MSLMTNREDGVNLHESSCFWGSATIDSTYHVNHFMDAMEIISADKMESFSGGKGFNQAIAFVRIGSDVHFAGAVGSDGKMVVDTLKKRRSQH